MEHLEGKVESWNFRTGELAACLSSPHFNRWETNLQWKLTCCNPSDWPDCLIADRVLLPPELGYLGSILLPEFIWLLAAESAFELQRPLGLKEIPIFQGRRTRSTDLLNIQLN